MMTDSGASEHFQVPVRGQSNRFCWIRAQLDPLLAIVISIVLGLMTINKLLSVRLHADTIILSVMSIQKPTLFYWGQDRYFNLIPILLSPIKDAGTNLFLHLVIFSSAFYGLLIAIAYWSVSYLSDKAPPIDRYLLAAITIVLAPTLLSSHALYMMSAEAQPYVISLLFLLGAVQLLLKSDQTVGRTLGGLACMILGAALNPGVLIVAAAIGCGALAFVSWMRVGSFAASAIAGFLLWMLAAQSAPHPDQAAYFQLDLRSLQFDLLKALNSIATDIYLPALIALVGAILVAELVAPSQRSQRLNILSLGTIAFCLCWWGFFGINEWIKMNAFNGRYFSPIYIAICVGGAVALYLPLSRFAVWRKLVIITLCSVISIALLVRSPLLRPKDIAIFRRVASVAEYAKSHRIRFFAGDYWLVWPTVFMTLDRPNSAFGLASRGLANRSQVRRALAEELARGSTPRLLCLKDSVEQCDLMARKITGTAWRPTEASCRGACRVLKMVR